MSNLGKKGPFMGIVFSNLIFQCFVAYTAAIKADKAHVDKNRWMYLIAFIASLLTLTMGNLSIQMKVVLFTIFSAITGALSSRHEYSPELIKEVGMIFTGMLILGIVSIQLKIDLRPYTPILIAALVGLIVARLFSKERKNLGKIGTLLFAIFVVFDTNNILQTNYEGDFVQASLDYFVNIINLLNSAEDS